MYTQMFLIHILTTFLIKQNLVLGHHKVTKSHTQCGAQCTCLEAKQG